MTKTFGTLLRQARRNCRDPDRGGPLTQERFAELLAQQLEPMRVTAATISNWERGTSQPPGSDRRLLGAIVSVLLKYSGLMSLDEANTLLIRGGYAGFSDDEMHHVRGNAPNAHLTSAAASEPHQHTHVDLSTNTTRTVIAIRHQSMEQIPANAIRAWLPADLQGCEYIEISIDQSDLFHHGRLIDPYEAARRQYDLEERVAAMLVQYPDAHLAYDGIAHIPLLFLAGYTLSNRRAILLFENDRYTRHWNLLQQVGNAPQLHLSGLPADREWRQGDVVVRISISYHIAEDTIAEILSEPLASIELRLDQPRVDAVTSEVQLWAYARAFRDMMDQIHYYVPHATGIPIFYAGPPALAFACGQQVSKTIHPRVVVYNFFGRDQPRYSWGLDFMSHIDSDGFVARPSGGLGDS
jgi:hypothetical protein